jgi:hypothetical protein
VSEDHLNATAELQLRLSELGVIIELLGEAAADAAVALTGFAEEAVARGELALARDALDVAERLTEKVRRVVARPGS